ncbi:hypothetical protein [Streptomyces sp. cmx-10-25]|uniref:hypothetical protein n=1 Tax=Streptomyces sp. cmx-10-25 TaxID=2790919 RepID=UPI0039800630
MSALALKGPYWVTSRQHRRALWTALALAGTAVAVLIASRLWSDSTAEALRATGCTYDSLDPSCFQPARVYADGQWLARHLVEYAALGMLVLPVLLGAFVAGPVLARELETGTYRLAWTQSVSPARWLAAKVAVPAALVLTAVPLLSLVFFWSWSTGPSHTFPTHWHEPTMFVSFGIVPTAHALLGLALGTAVGVVVRRTVVAMGVTFLFTGAALALLSRLRDDLWTVRTVTGSVTLDGEVWRLGSGMLTSSGERLLWEDCWVVRSGDARQCMTDRGGVVEFVDTHPASHYWPLQFVESGICLALAALATLLAFRVLRARHP